MEAKGGPVIDKILMRSKDVALLGMVLWGLIKWFYIVPLQTQERVNRQEVQLVKIMQTLETQSGLMKNLDDRLGKIEGLLPRGKK